VRPRHAFHPPAGLGGTPCLRYPTSGAARARKPEPPP